MAYRHRPAYCFMHYRADFNSNRRFYHWTSDFGEYLEGMADKEQSSEIKTVTDLLDEIEDENLYSIYCGVTRMHLWRFNLHKTNAANEELVISLFYGREVQERKRYPIATYILTA